MKIAEAELSKLSRQLEQARAQRKATPQLTKTHEALSVADAYRIQAAGIRMRATKGERIVGYKMGLTSKAKMQQMGVSQPIFGVLTESMQILDASAVDTAAWIHPRIEPEIAFILGRDVDSVLSPSQALQACSGVCAALEIIDSRYQDFSFTLPDVIADNCSSAGFVLGAMSRRPDRIDCSNLGMVMEKNGEAVQFASSAAILGHPARSLAELIRILVGQGEVLRAGSIVLAGGATAAIPLTPGAWIRLEVQGLGSTSVTVK